VGFSVSRDRSKNFQGNPASRWIDHARYRYRESKEQEYTFALPVPIQAARKARRTLRCGRRCGVDRSTHFLNPRISWILLKSSCVTVNPPPPLPSPPLPSPPRALADPLSAFPVLISGFLIEGSARARASEISRILPKRDARGPNFVGPIFSRERRRAGKQSDKKQARVASVVIFINARAATLMNLRARLSRLLIREIQEKKTGVHRNNAPVRIRGISRRRRVPLRSDFASARIKGEPERRDRSPRPPSHPSPPSLSVRETVSVSSELG